MERCKEKHQHLLHLGWLSFTAPHESLTALQTRQHHVVTTELETILFVIVGLGATPACSGSILSELLVLYSVNTLGGI